MSSDPTLDIFFEECAEILKDAEAQLLKMEASPGDKEALCRLFRSAHTIKGTSGMLGFEAVAAFTHAMEDLLDRLRRTGEAPRREIIDTLLLSLDMLKDLILEAKGEGACDPALRDDLLLRLRRHIASDQDTAAARGNSEAAAPAPSPPSCDPDGGPRQTAQAPVPVVPSTGPSGAAPLPQTGKLREDSAGREVPVVSRGIDAATIRVPIEKVDRLVNLVGELVSTQSMVAQIVSGFRMERLLQLEEAITVMDRHSRELQERVMAIRMLPIRTLFTRFVRVVRDIAPQLGKQVTMVMSGEETELDKTVIEKIGDPLLHLIRNAVDHGIESPKERVALGKRAQGRLQLSAYQRGGNIFIEVSDDGKGLSRDKILKKAIQLDLVRADDVLTDAEVFALIFRPGFSTAEKLTEISGRGVGMDVVKRNVEELKGTIFIESELGQGTTFRIKLPLTLAIIDGLALQVGEQNYIVPLVSIVESVRPQPGDIKTVLGRGEVINVRGEYLPLIRLYEVFDIRPNHTDPCRGLVVITDDGNGKLAFLVDELLGQFQAVIKSLESNFRKVFGIAGATILGDGRVALILDIAGLMRAAHERGCGNAMGRGMERSIVTTLAQT